MKTRIYAAPAVKGLRSVVLQSLSDNTNRPTIIAPELNTKDGSRAICCMSYPLESTTYNHRNIHNDYDFHS